MGDTVPLIDAQTANILGSINKFTVQQHVKVFDNCIEQPNTYTIYNLETNQALIRVQERSECFPRICCAPHHSIILEFNALDPAGNEMFPGAPPPRPDREFGQMTKIGNAPLLTRSSNPPPRRSHHHGARGLLLQAMHRGFSLH
jgi:hypothetical protein